MTVVTVVRVDITASSPGATRELSDARDRYPPSHDLSLSRGGAAGPHRLMLRPRESRDVRLLSSTLEMTPAASVSWTNDVFGNAVVTAVSRLADGLTIESRAAVELGASPWPVFDIAASAIHYPFFYSSEERADLGALAVPQTFDRVGPARRLGAGLRARHPHRYAGAAQGHGGGCGGGDRLPEPRGGGHADAVADASIAAGARAATSPCCSPRRRAAWASARASYRAISTIRIARRCRKIGAGRIGVGGLDPCVDRDLPARCGLDHLRSDQPAVGGYNLIPLAVGRVIAQVMPMTGTFLGMTDAYLGMSVDVEVTP